MRLSRWVDDDEESRFLSILSWMVALPICINFTTFVLQMQSLPHIGKIFCLGLRNSYLAIALVVGLLSLSLQLS